MQQKKKKKHNKLFLLVGMKGNIVAMKNSKRLLIPKIKNTSIVPLSNHPLTIYSDKEKKSKKY